MLSAFNYSDVIYEKEKLENRVICEKEKDIIYRRTISLAKKNVSNLGNHICPCCQGKVKYFFSKWGFNFLRCQECYSIFSDVSQNICEEYMRTDEIIRCRTSNTYQIDEFQHRREQWRELLEWLEFRCYRYLSANEGLDIIDYGNRFIKFVELIRDARLCKNYELRDSIIKVEQKHIDKADIILYMTNIQQTLNPIEELQKIRSSMKRDGILFLSSRLGTGFDVLTLKENNEKIMPLEHMLLPSIKGLEKILSMSGFRILEIVTPGNLDVAYVLRNKDKIADEASFLQYMFSECDGKVFNELQRFLQKNRLSSYVQIIARKV